MARDVTPSLGAALDPLAHSAQRVVGVVTELKQFGTLAASGRGASRAWHQHVDQNVVALAFVNDRTDHGGVSSKTPVPPRLARASLAGEHGERMALLECQRRSATSR